MDPTGEIEVDGIPSDPICQCHRGAEPMESSRKCRGEGRGTVWLDQDLLSNESETIVPVGIGSPRFERSSRGEEADRRFWIAPTLGPNTHPSGNCSRHRSHAQSVLDPGRRSDLAYRKASLQSREYRLKARRSCSMVVLHVVICSGNTLLFSVDCSGSPPLQAL